MQVDSRLIKKESKIAKEKVYQFVLADNTVEDIKSMSLKKAVKSFQNKFSKLKIAKVYYVNKKGNRILSIVKLKVGRKKKLGRWS
jgi:serine/threonine-protein kinase RIO1